MSSGNALSLSLTENHYLNFKFVAFYSTLENSKSSRFKMGMFHKLCGVPRFSFLTACGGKFSDLTGQIASPSYPRSYPTDVECVWELSASPGNRLILTFENMDIELSDKCNEDYLEIRENGVSGDLIG